MCFLCREEALNKHLMLQILNRNLPEMSRMPEAGARPQQEATEMKSVFITQCSFSFERNFTTPSFNLSFTFSPSSFRNEKSFFFMTLPDQKHLIVRPNLPLSISTKDHGVVHHHSHFPATAISVVLHRFLLSSPSYLHQQIHQKP